MSAMVPSWGGYVSRTGGEKGRQRMVRKLEYQVSSGIEETKDSQRDAEKTELSNAVRLVLPSCTPQCDPYAFDYSMRRTSLHVFDSL